MVGKAAPLMVCKVGLTKVDAGIILFNRTACPYFTTTIPGTYQKKTRSSTLLNAIQLDLPSTKTIVAARNQNQYILSNPAQSVCPISSQHHKNTTSQCLNSRLYLTASSSNALMSTRQVIKKMVKSTYYSSTMLSVIQGA
jgi:hypothetical protein